MPKTAPLHWHRRRQRRAHREYDLCGEQIVEREPEAADQRPVAAAQGEPGHTHGADRSGHCREAKRICDASNVGGAGASRNYCATAIDVEDHAAHAAEADDDAGAQRAPGPIVPATPHRQWKTAIACDANGQLDVFSRPAVNDRTRHAAHWLRPDRGRGGIAVVARPRHTAGQLPLK